MGGRLFHKKEWDWVQEEKLLIWCSMSVLRLPCLFQTGFRVSFQLLLISSLLSIYFHETESLDLAS